VKWRTRAGNGIASPVIQDGRLYTMGSLRLEADAQDGVSEDEMYTRTELRQARSSLADSMGITPEHFPYQPASTYAFCFDAYTGEQLWATKIAELEFLYCSEGINIPRAAPLVYDGKVYCQTHAGMIACVNAQAGQVVWKKSIGELGSTRSYHFGKAGVGGAPFVHGGRIFYTYPFNNSLTTVAAFDANTGDTLWTRNVDTGFRVDILSASVAEIEGKATIVVPGGFRTYGIDPADGALLWEFNAHTQWPEIDPEVNRGDTTDCVYWKDQHPGKIPVIWNNHIVSRVYTWAGHKDDRTYCIKITGGTPSLVWDKKTVRYWRGMHIARDSLLFAMDYGHARPPCPEPTCREYPCHSEKRYQCINIRTGHVYWTTDEFTSLSDPNNFTYGSFEPEHLVVGDHVIVIHMRKIGYGRFDLSGVTVESSVAKNLWGVSPMAMCNGLLYFQKMDVTTELTSEAANLFCLEVGSAVGIGGKQRGSGAAASVVGAASGPSRLIVFDLAGKRVRLVPNASVGQPRMPRGIYVVEVDGGATVRRYSVANVDGGAIHPGLRSGE